MNYVSVAGSIIIEHRDATSLAAIRRRVYEDVRNDHNGYDPQLTHTHQQNDCIVAMSRHGYRVSAGYRGSLYLKGGQQLAPDARLTVHFCQGDFPTEYMRGRHRIPWGGPSRAERQKIRRQLEQYVPKARQFGSLSVACLCQNEAVIEVAGQEAANIARDYDVALHALAMLEGTIAVGDAAPGRPDFIRPIYMLTHWYVEYERFGNHSPPPYGTS